MLFTCHKEPMLLVIQQGRPYFFILVYIMISVLLPDRRQAPTFRSVMTIRVNVITHTCKIEDITDLLLQLTPVLGLPSGNVNRTNRIHSMLVWIQ